MRVRLEYRDEKSQKFWQIETEGDSHTVNFGRIGTNGQTKTKSFPTAEAAEVDAEKMAAKKRKKGYVDAAPGGATPAASAAKPKAKATKAKVTKAKTAKAKTAKATTAKATKSAPKAKSEAAVPVDILDRYVERIDAAEREIKGEIYKDDDKKRLRRAMAYIRGESTDLPKDFDTEHDWECLTDIFAPLREWTEVDLRVLDVLMVMWIRKRKNYEHGFHDTFYTWLEKQLVDEGTDSLYPRVLEVLAERGIEEQMLLRHTISELDKVFENADSEPTSVGRYLLSRYPADAAAMLAVGTGKRYGTSLCRLLARHARKDFDEQLPEWWKGESEWGTMQLARALMELDGEAYGKDCTAALKRCKEPWPRFQIVEALHHHDAKTFGEEARAIAEANLKAIQKERNGKDSYSDAAWDSSTGRFKQKTPQLLEFLLGNFGHDVKDAVFDYVENTKALSLAHIEIATKHLGQAALPMVAEGFGVPIESGDNAKFLAHLLRILNTLDWSEHHDKVWAHLEHKSKPIRETAAMGLSALGADAIPRAVELTKAKKKEQRHGGAMLLGFIGDDASMDALGELIAKEKADDVRDPALETLDRAMRRRDIAVTDAMVEQRFERALTTKKLDKPPFKWLKESALPTLKWAKGKQKGKDLSDEWVRYLVYRQARQSAGDVDPELRPVLERIDRKTSAPFGVALWEAFIKAKANAKEKACAVLAGELGQEELVGAMAETTLQWAGGGRGAMAEVCVHVLARIESDVALRAIDDLRRARKGIASNVTDAAEEAFNEAADLRGISADELADRVVPDLGFVGGLRPLDVDGDDWNARLRSDFKLEYIAPTGKVAKSPPKAASKALKAELKDFAKLVREVAKIQKKRLTAAMVLGRRWNAETFKELMLGKAIRVPFVVSTVWGVYEEGKLVQTFRPLGDDSFTSVDNDVVELGKGATVGIVHTAELSASERTAWTEHFADHEVAPLLPQLVRPVVRCPKAKAKIRICDDFDGTEVSTGKLLGRLGGAGWRRGSVVDAGGISAYHRSFGPFGVDAILKLSNVNIGGESWNDAELGHLMFVKDGSVSYGSYVYDEPRTEDDERLIALGDVPMVVYSEVMGDIMPLTE